MTALPVPEHLPLKAVQKVLPHFSLPAPVLQDLPDILSDTLLPLLSEELFLLFLRMAECSDAAIHQIYICIVHFFYDIHLCFIMSGF